MLNLKNAIFAAASLLVGSALADLPSNEEYLAMQLAMAEACPRLLPAHAARIQRGSKVLICDLTDGTSERREQFKQMQSRPTFQEQKKKAVLKLEIDPSLSDACIELAEYPEKGQFCSLISDTPPAASPRNAKP